MALDYNGIPRKDHRRELKDPLNFLREDSPIFFEEDPVVDDDILFRDIAKAYMKGKKLQDGLGDMNPAAFIPVEKGAKVRSAIQRVEPNETADRITFGLFKEACQFIADRGQAFDEEFIVQFDSIDPTKIHGKVNARHKGIESSGGDWITEFLIALSPIAGLMLASYIADIGQTNSNKAPVPDGQNTGMQPSAFHGQGVVVGLALLIEMGLTALIFYDAFDTENDTLGPEIREQFNGLSQSPSKRRAALEGAGYDYEALTQNKKFDDYMEIKRYSLDYISSLGSDLNYDHWIAWANVLENQAVLRGSLAMAPMFSRNWKKFTETNDSTVFSRTDTQVEEDDKELDFNGALKNGLDRGLKNYFGSVLDISNNHYNRAAQAFSMQIDERLMCCILWFLGPLNTSSLENMSKILRLLSLDAKLNWRDFLARLTEGALSSVLNMLSAYVSKLVSTVFDDVLKSMFAIPGQDLDVALKKCVGLDILFGLIEKAMIAIAKLIKNLIDELNAMIESIGNKATAYVDLAAERRWMTTLAALIDAIVNKLNQAQSICTFDQNIDPATANELAAEAAVDFVSVELPNAFPVLNLSEDVRRKFFKDAPAFKTSNLEVDVPGFGSAGEQEEITRDFVVSECGEGNRALEGIILGQKIAKAMNNK
jgi:hypothetical protein